MSSPAVRLTKAEVRLMEAIDRRGLPGFVLTVTGVSVALSVAITMPMLKMIDSGDAELAIGLLVSVAVPSIVAPLAATMLGRLLQALAHASVELRYLSLTDSLTGVANRRAFAAEASTLIERRGTGVFIAAMVDVDQFKAVNDRFGHSAGDQVLITLAAKLRDVVDERCRDAVVGRLGGDEFAVAAVVGGDDDAIRLVDALRHACDLSEVRSGVTASIGAYIAQDATSLDDALAHADHALYSVKQPNDRRTIRGRG